MSFEVCKKSLWNENINVSSFEGETDNLLYFILEKESSFMTVLLKVLGSPAAVIITVIYSAREPTDSEILIQG